ncbi:uncharacterized protein LOC122022628 [Zingiber officinale]|uniref:IST1-like protein n=1 Tax=Zingiber officinale TaxID=94328 RepID=A0A8J5KI13_ZINOF|nr:uncharacterized protein LOC122022628 [Zingiber officinale]KAG6477497.1 hypothetical protein ZIOFF_066764 [Zingiber officinale]
MFSKSFKAAKCKTTLKLAVSRSKLLKNKGEAQVRTMRRDLSQLLQMGQDEIARIRVQHVIKEEKMMSAYDLIETYCELIVEFLPIIESQKSCPKDLKEPICSVIFASPRCTDIPELKDIKKQFTAKYGKEFVSNILEVRPDCGVSRMMIEKLSTGAPEVELKLKVLIEVAREHNVKWEPKSFVDEIKKPRDDLLNDPIQFTSANTMLMQSSDVVLSSSHITDEQVKLFSEIGVRGNSIGLDKAPSVSIYSPNILLNPLGSERRPVVEEVSCTNCSKRNSSFNSNNWSLEFKDAVSAAEVAAEAAEKASLAARAAAELASHGNYSVQHFPSHESSAYVIKDEVSESLQVSKPEVARFLELPKNQEDDVLEYFYCGFSESSSSSFSDTHRGCTGWDVVSRKEVDSSILISDQNNSYFDENSASGRSSKGSSSKLGQGKGKHSGSTSDVNSWSPKQQVDETHFSSATHRIKDLTNAEGELLSDPYTDLALNYETNDDSTDNKDCIEKFEDNTFENGPYAAASDEGTPFGFKKGVEKAILSSSNVEKSFSGLSMQSMQQTPRNQSSPRNIDDLNGELTHSAATDETYETGGLNLRPLKGGLRNRSYRHLPHLTGSVLDSVPQSRLSSYSSSPINKKEDSSNDDSHTPPYAFRVRASKSYADRHYEKEEDQFQREVTAITLVKTEDSINTEDASFLTMSRRATRDANLSRRTRSTTSVSEEDTISRIMSQPSSETPYKCFSDRITDKNHNNSVSSKSVQLNLSSEEPCLLDKEVPPIKRSQSSPIHGLGISSVQRNGGPNTSTSVENLTSHQMSLKRASHVHPKLPDYDTIVAHLQSLRLNSHPT